MTTSSKIEDGFGNCWAKCDHALCDLQVVRPGKVQCSDWCAPMSAKAHIDKLIAHVQAQEKMYEGFLQQDDEDNERLHRDLAAMKVIVEGMRREAE